MSFIAARVINLSIVSIQTCVASVFDLVTPMVSSPNCENPQHHGDG
jgi:hypothetical protein